MDVDDRAGEVAERAVELESQGMLDDAIALLATEQIELNHPGLWHNLGRLQLDAERFDDAIESYSRAIQLGYPSHVSRGLVYDVTMRNAEAEADYRTALGIDPNDVEALVNLGTLMVEVGRVREALELLYAAANLDPTANWQRAEALLAVDQPGLALEAAEIAIAEGEPRANLEKALALVALSRDPIPAFEEAVKAGAGGAEVAYVTYLELGREGQ